MQALLRSMLLNSHGTTGSRLCWCWACMQVGTPLAVPSKGGFELGRIASLELNHKVRECWSFWGAGVVGRSWKGDGV